MFGNFNTLLITLIAAISIPFMSYSDSTTYAVLDLPPFSCEPSHEFKCINTEITTIVANSIDGHSSTICAFPYPRAISMFETGKSKILVALINKRLMANAFSIHLYDTIFYVVKLENDLPLKRTFVAYLNGADAQKQIAKSIDADPFEINNYHQIVTMLKAYRLGYAIIPRYLYESEVEGIIKNVHILSKHRLPVVLYVNKSESKHIKLIKKTVSELPLELFNKHKKFYISGPCC